MKNPDTLHTRLARARITLSFAAQWLAIAACGLLLSRLNGFGAFEPIDLQGRQVIKMLADPERPFVYAIAAPGAGATNGALLFINATNGAVTTTLPLGSDPFDAAINASEQRLYVLDRNAVTVHRANLNSQTALAPLPLGPIPELSTISGIGAGRFLAGGIGYYFFFNTSTGARVSTNWIVFDGDGEADASGSFFYLGTVGGTPPMIQRWAIQGDFLEAGAPVFVQQQQYVHPYGAYNLLSSPDGSRLFYNGNVYDSDLNHVAWLGEEVLACSADGGVVFTSARAFDSATWLPMRELPTPSTAMAVDGLSQRVWFYNGYTNTIESLSLALVQKPVFHYEPQNQTNLNGTTATLQVVAGGRSPLYYHWFRNGTGVAVTSTNLLSITNFQEAHTGTYSVIVSNAFGAAVSSPFMVEISYDPPEFVSHPGGLAVEVGGSATFSAEAAGAMPIAYQWRRNGTAIAGATNSVLELNNLQLGAEGSYDVVATNKYGAMNSSAAYLNVVNLGEALNASNLAWQTDGDAPWQVDFNSASDGFASARSGGMTTGQSVLRTALIGPGTLTFWWRFDNSVPFGSSALTFSANSVQQRAVSFLYMWEPVTVYLGAGHQVLEWIVLQAEDGGSAVGRVDQVTFAPGGTAPFVASTLTSRVAPIGSATTLEVEGLGTPPLRYQWRLNGTNLTGRTNATLELTNIQFVNEGSYSVVISNSFGVTNIAAFVDVVDLPEALNASDLVWSSGGHQPWFAQTSVTHDGVAALQSGAIAAGQHSTVGTTVTGPGVLSFWWRVSSQTNADYVNFTVDGAEQARISGLLNQWQQKTFYLAPGPRTLGWNYIKDASVTLGSDAAWLDEVSYAPGGAAAFVASGPADQVAPLSGAVTFAVVAGGTPPIYYQWFLNGGAISGATNSALTVSGIEMSDLGLYTVAVSNAYGSATSPGAALRMASVFGWGAGKTNRNFSPDWGQSAIPTNLGPVRALSAGSFHSAALRADGRVVVWGRNWFGETNTPVTLTNASAIAAGLEHTIALRSNGTITAWGSTSYGVRNVPLVATNIQAVAAGWYHNLALRTNGTVLAWGAGTTQSGPPSYGQSMVPTNLSGVAAIAAGGLHSLALRTNGTVIAWGWNAHGQTNVPPGLNNVVAIAAGGSNSIALKSDGTLVAWGANGNGQGAVPPGLTNVAAISCGAAHNLALLEDGTLYAWGWNTNGQTNVPGNVTNVAAMAAGLYHSLALVNSGPIDFIKPPYSVTVFKGSNAVFKPVVLGRAPIRFQWLHDGTNVAHGTNAVLQIPYAAFSDVGSYQLVASNAFGVVTSAVARLTVHDTAPFVVRQVADRDLLAGTNAIFTAEIGGIPPIRYQWTWNGVPIPAATNVTLVVSNVQLSSEGYYSLVASNAFGSVATSNAFLNVIDIAEALNATNLVWQMSPAGGWFVQSTVTQDGVAAVASRPVTNGNQNLLQTSVTGPGTLSFWWNSSFPFRMGFEIDGVARSTMSSSMWRTDTFYIGAGKHSLTWTVDSFSYFPSYGGSFLDQVTFVPGATPPVFSIQPRSQTNSAGAAVTLSASVIGTPAITYQWSLNGTAIPGATGATLTLNNIQSANAGSYHVVARNDYGTAVSSNAVLSVLPSAPTFVTHPADSSVLIGAALTLNGAAAGTEPIAYQWLRNGHALPYATNKSLTLHNAQVSDGGNYALVASNFLGLATSDSAFVSPYSFADLGVALNSPGMAWSTTNVAWFPQSLVTHDGVSAAQSGVISGSQHSTLQAIVEGPATVTYWWKVDCNDFWVNLSFNVNGAVQNYIAGNTQWRQATNFIGAGPHTVQWNLYPFRGSVAGGTGWVDRVEITVGGTPPMIVSNSPSITASAGTSATFSTIVGGTPPLRFQWKFNGQDIPGATNSSLTLNNVQNDNTGSYSMTTSNDFGWNESPERTLTVTNTKPVITVQPASQSQVFFSTARFNVGARGSSPLVYQWLHDGQPVPGATEPALVLENLESADAGLYSVTITNHLGAVTSVVARLDVSDTVVRDFTPFGQWPVPTPPGLSNIASIAAGQGHTVALKRDGSVLCWSIDPSLTNVPPGISNAIAVAAGDYHSVALLKDGSLALWGSDWMGQLSPPENLTSVVAVAAAGYSTLALKSDGTVVGWGANSYGQLNVPAGLSGVRRIALGLRNGFAIKHDGTLVQWGNTPIPQLTEATDLHHLEAITANFTKAWTLTADGRVTRWGTAFIPPMYNAVAIASSGVESSEDFVLILGADGVLDYQAGSGSFTPSIPTVQTNVIGIAAGYRHAAVLINDGRPALASPLVDRTVPAGGVLILPSGIASGNPANYQWQFNQSNIVGATNSVFVLTNVPLSAAGQYRCIAVNGRGSVTNGPAQVTVIRSIPGFVAAPGAATISGGHFHALATGLSGHGNVVIYGSTNLIHWEPLLTNPPVLGTLHFTEPLSTHRLQRFYRIEER